MSVRGVFVGLLMCMSVTLIASDFPKDPEKAKLITSDLENFLEAQRLIQEGADPLQTLKTHYFDKASPGLKEFIKLRIGSAENLLQAINTCPKHYKALHRSIEQIPLQEAAIRKGLAKLKKIYPNAVFPPVYFLVGRLSSAGTLSDKGLYIGVEMNARLPDSDPAEFSPEFFPLLKSIDHLAGIVCHELVHYQQSSFDDPTLLEQSIIEGSADFVGELVSGLNINKDVAYAYGLKHEAALWREFQETMHGKELGYWLYGSFNKKGVWKERPNDLGYFVGYRIVSAYYEKQSNKEQALVDILRFTDARKLLKESGYAPND